MNVGFISLGCNKNLVDTEIIIGIFKNHNFNIVNNPEDADILLINTCGFIQSAKEEAINTILEMAKYKEKRCKYLIATGCLVQRYKKDLEAALPEVDLFLTIDDYDNFWNIISNLIPSELLPDNSSLTKTDRVISTGKHMAYLKIAEGCSNHCTYCAIPHIRGPFVSREIESILKEANELSQKGYEEIILIAQDTTKYGIDLYGEPKLAYLLNEMCKIDGIKWIRFLYSYPETITDELIAVVKNNDKICKYFDIPIQHFSDSVLKRMNRQSTGEKITNLIKKLRTEIPNVILRTTLIVGFPGETEEDFNILYESVKDLKFDKLGTFTYSKEDGTPASRLPNQIHHSTKKSRYHKIMKLQQEISKENLKNKIGNIYETFIEGKSFDNKYYLARTYMDVPDIDGFLYIPCDDSSCDLSGTFVKCKITDIRDYDLVGELV